MSNVIPASIAHHFPGLDLSSDFPANVPFDEPTADIWADGRAEAAWRYGLMANQKLDQVLAKVGVAPVADPAVVQMKAELDAINAKIDALPDLINAHVADGASVDQLASAVMHHLSADTANG